MSSNKIEIKDPMKGKPKAFEEIAHGHLDNPTPLQKKQCQRCRYDIAESSIPKEPFTIKVPIGGNGGTKNKLINNITIVRGSLDDCVGWKF